MKRFHHAQALVRVAIICTALISTIVNAAPQGRSSPADPPANHQAGALTIGSLGMLDRLSFSGNSSFDSQQFINALQLHSPYYFASDSAASLTNYLASIENWIRLGYQRKGFHQVRVSASHADNTSSILIRIEEGPRLFCGDIQVRGANLVLKERLQQRLRDLVSATGSPSSRNSALEELWHTNMPAPFDMIATAEFARQATQVLESMGCLNPKATSEVVSRKEGKRADLVFSIEKAEESIFIEDIKIDGLTNNTRDAFLLLSGLKAGIESPSSIVSKATEKLLESGRFMGVRIEPEPGSKTGHYVLRIHVSEFNLAPSLVEPLPAHAEKLLQMRQWLLKNRTLSKDLITRIHMRQNAFAWDVKMILASGGLAILSEGPAESPSLTGHLIAGPKYLSYAEPSRREKLILTGDRGGVVALLNLISTPDLPPWEDQFNFELRFGMGSTFSTQPVNLTMNLSPAAFVNFACSPKFQTRVEDGKLKIQQRYSIPGQEFEMELDAESGRPIRAARNGRNPDGKPNIEVLWSEESGAFERARAEFLNKTAGFTNWFDTNSPYSSGIAFLLAQITRTPLLQPILSKDPRVIQASKAIAAFEKLDWRAICAPFGTLDVPQNDSLTRFSIPQHQKPTPLEQIGRESLLRSVAEFALTRESRLFVPGTWPQGVCRAAALAAYNETNAAAAILRRLHDSGAMGPVGHWMSMKVASLVDPDLASDIALSGTRHLTLGEFQSDCLILTSNSGVFAQFLTNALAQASCWDPEEAAAVGTYFGPGGSNLFRAVAQATHSSSQHSAVLSLSAMLTNAWGFGISNAFFAAFDLALPREVTPQTAQGLLARGLILGDGSKSPAESKEAADLIRRAADLGHPEAQFRYGKLLLKGLGVSSDPMAALEYMERAAAQHFPHAACTLASLYRQGLPGIPQNMWKARVYCEQDAQDGCATAQFRMASFSPSANQSALEWIEKAAAQDHPEALFALGMQQLGTNEVLAVAYIETAAVHGSINAAKWLGNHFSDDLFGKPDLASACLWLKIAADAGDKIAEFQVRKVSMRLTPEQRETAFKRAEALRINPADISR